ncbi:prolyl oligopeptidase family serine peptidase [Sphingosinicella sp. GR2756]|uniref:prolyl oligopeptidase n=2 Tax=Sphingosinicella rhizophila TaxID=3050082 RepID=A0ABU3Q4C0_9SPHN|nr:prolyl oligopeptidase family serine peptidase [Sphingosinicella sp. GR2756]
MSFTDTIGGVAVSDPYRWLEDDADPKVIEWQKQANARAAAALAASPHAAEVAAAVRATYEDVFTYAAPQRFGDKWFRTRLPEGGSNTVLEVADSATGQGRVLVDPSDEGEDVTLALWHPSPDGTLAVIATSQGGAMNVRVIDVTDGHVVLDLGHKIGTAFYVWAPDKSGVYYMQMAMKALPDGQMVPETRIIWQPLAGEAAPLDLPYDHPMAWPVMASDGGWMAITCDQTAPRPRWIRKIDGGEWTRFLPDATAMYKGALVGDDFIAISDDVSGWCRLVAIPLTSFDDESTWRELIPARAGVKLASMTRCGAYLVLSRIEGGIMKMSSLDLSGKAIGDVDLPGDGAFGLTGVGHIGAILTDIIGSDGDGCVFVHSSLERSPGVYRADLTALTCEELVAPAHVLSDRIVDALAAKGPAGDVAYRMMREAATPLDGSAPVIVTGYGGFNVPWIPYYSAMGAAWTELGGIWVHAHLRGGGEQDKDFWHAGRMKKKQGTFDDLYAVLEDLQARGWAVAERTGLWGSSNGGLLVGAAVTQRPDLFRAAVAQVPILDLLQCRKDPGSIGICMADYGNPDDPADAPGLHGISPYHNVRAGTAYPALLCDAGATDLTCPPWHTRKMIAAMEEASTSDRRQLLRVRGGAGHNQMTTEKAIERDVEELAFLADELMD